MYYGQNVISKDLIIANRKELLNGNGFVLGVSGSGKSFTAKREMVNLALSTKDDIIVIDPESEYRPLIEGLGGYQGKAPTLQDFHAELLRQSEQEARDVALAIELFTEGSLNTFAKPTNVDTDARILCYDIRDLGKQLLPVGMLVVLDSVFNRVIRNRALDRNTWVYIDEIYILFQHEYSANFLFAVETGEKVRGIVYRRHPECGRFAPGPHRPDHAGPGAFPGHAGDMALSDRQSERLPVKTREACVRRQSIPLSEQPSQVTERGRRKFQREQGEKAATKRFGEHRSAPESPPMSLAGGDKSPVQYSFPWRQVFQGEDAPALQKAGQSAHLPPAKRQRPKQSRRTQNRLAGWLLMGSKLRNVEPNEC